MAEILKFTEDHLWLRVEGNRAQLGISDYGQEELGEVIAVELPDVGDEVEKGEPFGELESVRTVSELVSPLSGTVTAIPPGALQAMLPATIAGFTRGDVESASGAAAGLGGSRAEGRYTLGDQSFSLSIADMGAMGAIATLGGAVNAQSSKQTATGYEKTEMVGGSMVSEKWNTQDHSGSYETMVASRFAVSANGNAPSIDTLKQAVATVDPAALASLAK